MVENDTYAEVDGLDEAEPQFGIDEDISSMPQGMQGMTHPGRHYEQSWKNIAFTATSVAPFGTAGYLYTRLRNLKYVGMPFELVAQTLGWFADGWHVGANRAMAAIMSGKAFDEINLIVKNHGMVRAEDLLPISQRTGVPMPILLDVAQHATERWQAKHGQSVSAKGVPA